MTVHPFHAVPMDFNTWPPTDTRSSNPTNPEPCTHGRQRTPEVQILQKKNLKIELEPCVMMMMMTSGQFRLGAKNHKK